MHEASLITSLFHQITAIMQQQSPGRVVGVIVKIGVLSHISPAHLREHFAHSARGTIVEGARLTIEIGHDPGDPWAQDVVLEGLEVEEE